MIRYQEHGACSWTEYQLGHVDPGTVSFTESRIGRRGGEKPRAAHGCSDDPSTGWNYLLHALWKEGPSQLMISRCMLMSSLPLLIIGSIHAFKKKWN